MWLTETLARQMVDHLRAALPNEACGVIVGRGERAVEIIPIPNTAADPIHSYYMDEQRLAQVLTTLDGRGLELIGFYHSHPQGDPIPSPTDIQTATYPDTPYLIVGLKGGEARLAAWRMKRGRVDAVPVHVGDQAPPEADANAPSPAQKIAVILSALIAFLVVIVVSLTLLPPAPALPH